MAPRVTSTTIDDAKPLAVSNNTDVRITSYPLMHIQRIELRFSGASLSNNGPCAKSSTELRTHCSKAKLSNRFKTGILQLKFMILRLENITPNFQKC